MIVTSNTNLDVDNVYNSNTIIPGCLYWFNNINTNLDIGNG